MMRTWILRGFVALVAFAVAASAARATPPEPTTNPDDKQTLILLQLQSVMAKLNALQTNQDVQIKAMQDDIAQLKADVSRLNDELRRLAPTTTNVAASINPAAPASPLVTGNILLENLYGSPASFVVNGQTYRVNPFERVVVAAPVGPFSYAVFTDDFGLVQGTTNRFLAPGREFPITVHP